MWSVQQWFAQKQWQEFANNLANNLKKYLESAELNINIIISVDTIEPL